MEAVTDFLKMLNVEASQWSVTLSLFLVFLGLLYWYAVYPFSVLSRCGISHPKPSPFLGNLFLFREGFFKPLQDLVAKHGKVCGYYLGRKPIVVIADPDILRQVMVKDFNSFPNRLKIVLTSKPMSDCLLFLRDDAWKRVRSILTPSFSAAKMKEMVPLINTASDVLMTNLGVFAESGESFDIYKCFGCFTMDVIASVAFGTHVDSQNHVDDPFVRHAKLFFSFSFFRPIMLLFLAFPFLAPLVRILPNQKRDTMNQFFSSTIQKIIQQREELPPEERRRDFLQLMLDARTSKDDVSLEDFDTAHPAAELRDESQQSPDSPYQQDESESGHQQKAARPQKRSISEDEIVGQAFVFLVAGYETSSNTLGFTCYLLAKHPECQRRVQEELDRFFARHESADYTTIQELKYLDMVISETLRLYPPAIRFGREIERDCVVNGLSLPNGATLEIPAIFLHRDPEHWPDPEKFDPERFTPEAKAARHPFVYLPFGAGPRNCVGMRLAQLEMKMALARLFRTFSLVTCAETEDPLELKSFSTLGPKNGIFVKIQKRDMNQAGSGSITAEQ